jgi:hypothetical protein
MIIKIEVNDAMLQTVAEGVDGMTPEIFAKIMKKKAFAEMLTGMIEELVAENLDQEVLDFSNMDEFQELLPRSLRDE